MIDLENDDLRPVSEIAFARIGKRPAFQTIWRWRTIGVRGMKLEMVHVCGVWCTTASAFAEFIRGQSSPGFGQSRKAVV